MKEKLARLKPSGRTLAAYIMIAALLFRELPYLLETGILLLSKRPIPHLTYALLEYTGVLILPLSALWLWRAAGYASRKAAATSALLLGCAYVLERAGMTILQEKFLLKYADRLPVYYGAMGGILLLCFLLVVWAMPGSRKKIKGNLWIAAGMLLWLVLLAAADVAVGLASDWILPSFGTNVMLRAAAALVDTCIFTMIFHHLACAEEKKGWKIKLIFAPLGIVGCIVAQVLLVRVNPVEQIGASVAENMTVGAMELAKGNLETASGWFRRAKELRDAWAYTTGITEEDLLENGEKATLLQSRYLYWQSAKDVDAMENCLLEEDVDLNFAISLLKNYGKSERKMSGRSRAVRQDILNLMVAQDVFTNDVLMLEDLKGQRNKLAKQFVEFEELQVYCDAVDVLTQTGKEGEVSEEQMETMLTLAEQTPEDINLQYFAVAYGCAVKSDRAVHYERTMEAGERFVSLYEKAEGVTEEQKKQSQLQLINWALDLGLYEKAEAYCQELLKTGETEEVLMILAQCQNDLKQSEECYETSQRILALNPENYGALYFCTVTQLQNREIDAAIESTLKLSQMVQSLEGEKQHQAEVMFYDVIQLESFNDVGFTLQICNNLTEEQRAVIKKDAFYADYLDAAYMCFAKRDYENALNKVENVLATEPELSQANYLKGCIYFGMDDYENAIKAYKKALSIDDTSATAWYSLASAYDACEQYEEAYDACERVSSLLPDTDHVFDPYGVAIHNRNLKYRLAQQLGVR